MADIPLHQKHCIPCEGKVDAFPPDEVEFHAGEVPAWEIVEGDILKLRRAWKFKNFHEAMDFVNAVALLADNENHHPDIHIYYNKVEMELWTHAAGGLTENDFIMAAKIDRLG